MKYDLANAREVAEAKVYLDKLIGQKSLAEVKKGSRKRSPQQNNYLHLLIGAFGQHFGYTMDEAKLVYKDLNAGIYKYVKKGRTFYRSSADITKEEMAKSIDVFRAASEKAGYPLPLATDQDWLRAIENEIERSKYYL